MATNTFVPIFLPEASDLADLRGIGVDLTNARNYAERLAKMHVDRKDYDSVELLTVATLVSYSRAFVSGVRKRLRQDALAVLSPDQRAYHDYLRDIRDKHVAHSVNSFEENQPIARYWLERVDVEGITSIECQHIRIVGLSAQDAHAVIDLVTTLLAHVEARMDLEKAKLLELVRKLPLQDVLKGEFPKGTDAGPTTARKRRARLDLK